MSATGVVDCFEDCEGPQTLSATAACNPGERATGGGVSAAQGRQDAVIVESRPVEGAGQTPTAWTGQIRFTVTSSRASFAPPTVWVVCAA